jgi:hypothetical protein
MCSIVQQLVAKQYMFFMARKKALRDSQAGEPRQGVKVCDLLNSETVPLRYMLRIRQNSAHMQTGFAC